MLDDAMWYAVYSLGGMTVTGSLEVRYRRPVRPGEGLLVFGEAFSPRHRVFPARAVVVAAERGEAVAEGEGRFRETEMLLPQPWSMPG